jgi:hypothetical protein
VVGFGILFGLVFGLFNLLCAYFHPFTQGQWYGWRSGLSFIIPYSLVFGVVAAFANWYSLERRYALDPLRTEDLVSVLEVENNRLRRFVLFCLAAVLILAALYLRAH